MRALFGLTWLLIALLILLRGVYWVFNADFGTPFNDAGLVMVVIGMTCLGAILKK